jgi:hypothetical protein
MFRKIVFALMLITALVATSASASAANKQQPPSFEKVFTPLPLEGQWVGMLGSPTQFKGALYLSTSMGPADLGGGQIWRSFDGNTWAPMTNLGWGDMPYENSWDMTVYKGKLYVPANSAYPPDPAYPGVIFRSSNGTDWEQIPLETGITNLDKLGEFKGMLYATSVNGTDPDSPGGLIWRSSSGDQGTWTVVQELEPGTASSSSPVAYKGKVYISGYAGDSNNIILWSSSDGLDWETQYVQITESSDDWLRDGMLTIFKGDLYLCTLNWNDGGTIYRTHDGKNWQPVFQISFTPDSKKWVIAVEDLIEYQGDLYAATVFFDDNNGDWGAQIWRSHSGDPGTWMQITEDANWLYAFPERGAFGTFNGQLYFTDSGGANPALYRMNGK